MSKTIYCDHAATTPINQEVLEYIFNILKEDFGNPSSLHKYGRKAKHLLEEARQKCSLLLNCEPSEIIFTSGGTESNNMAINGVLEFAKQNNISKNHFITTVIEHSSIYKPLKRLEALNYPITWLSVNDEGFINLEELKNSIQENTLLVSIMHANNEIGTIQNIKEIGNLCKKNNILFHTDAIQSAGKIPIDVKEYNIDLLSLSGHKLYAPKGVGLLYKKNNINILPILYGGNQEKNFKPGTENLAGIMGLAKAIEIRMQIMEEESIYLKKLQSKLITNLLEIPQIILNGTKDLSKRLSGNINISFEDIKSDAIILQLDLKNICASSGSACTSGSIEPSRIISALYPNQIHLAYNSIRFSLGALNQESDIESIILAIKNIISKLRKVSINKL